MILGRRYLSRFLLTFLGHPPPEIAELVPLAGTANGESRLQPLTSSASSVGPGPTPRIKLPLPYVLALQKPRKAARQGLGRLFRAAPSPSPTLGHFFPYLMEWRAF